MKSCYQLVMTITIKKKKQIHSGKMSPVKTLFKVKKLLHFWKLPCFNRKVLIAMVIVINSVIGGFS